MTPPKKRKGKKPGSVRAAWGVTWDGKDWVIKTYWTKKQARESSVFARVRRFEIREVK